MAVQLLPCTEGEALDAMHKYVLKFDKDKKADKISGDNQTLT
ncbi:hypothetical protein C8P67_11310 [Flavobacterium aquicola]|uniref:Uncharacterized protein n=1 Tax=Flavobacterium aquicola TaxID=1682742 RepID=A0A3E0E749_9FLAO|nr:hypothetical protein C8P67_11310 [Flavobacterium aquicola]